MADRMDVAGTRVEPIVKCAVCEAVLPEATAPALDIPFMGRRIYLCDAHSGDALRAGGSIVKFLADAGVSPDKVKRCIDGARGVEKVVRAVRGGGGAT